MTSSFPESQQVQSLDKVVVFFLFFYFYLFIYLFFEDLIKIEDAGVTTTLRIDFSNIQGQLTPQSRVESG